jgi:hypothetical protein
MKRYIIISLILLSLFACAGPRGDAAGIINSERISYPDFIHSYQGHTANFQQTNQRMPNADEKKAIFQNTWKNISTHVILKDYFKRYQITVSEQEVIDSLMANIPTIVTNNPAFTVNGKFDRELYYQSIRYDSPINMSGIRRNYYEYYVPVQKLKDRLINEDLRNTRKIGRIAEIAVSKADFDLVVFDPQAMEPIISDSEIETFYKRNLQRFAMDPVYAVEYLSLPVNPLEADFIYTKAVTDSIYEQVMAGKSLDSVILERSAQLPGITLSEPGFVRIENIDPDTLPVLESLPDNAHSRPIPVGRGFAIYQKLQRTKSMLSYRALQIPPILSPSTINIQYSQALGALSLSKNLGIGLAAEELGLELVKHKDLSVNDLWYADKLIVEMVNTQLLERKKGDFLDPLYSTITGSWLVIRLSENMVNRVYPLSEVKQLIVPEILQTRRMHLAEQKAREWLSENPDFKPLPGKDNVQRFTKAGIDSEYAGHALDLVYVEALQRHLQKKAPQVHKLGSLHVILIPTAYYPQKGQKAELATIKSLYTRQLDPNWFENWMQDKRDKARVHIFVKP